MIYIKPDKNTKLPFITVSAQQNEAPAKRWPRIDKNTGLPFISVSDQQS